MTKPWYGGTIGLVLLGAGVVVGLLWARRKHG